MIMSGLTILILAQLGPAQLAADVPIKGQCLYPEQLVERAQGTTLITCNEARIDQRGGSVAFGLRSWEREVRFEGAFEEGRLTVERIQRPGRDPEDARGLCQLYYSNDELSTIACTAVAGPHSYAANFVVSRI